MKLYMIVTQDKYQLPLAVGDTMTEVEKRFGLGQGAFSVGLRAKVSKYIVVEVEDEDSI